MKKIFLTFISLAISLTPAQTVGSNSPPTKLREKFYIDIESDEISPGQNRYSEYVVQRQKNKHIEEGTVYWNEERHTWTLPYCEHTSLFPLSKAFPVVKSSYCYVLVDGHHHYLTNLRLGGTTIPITVIADYSHLSHDDFLTFAMVKGLIDPHDIYGNLGTLPYYFSEIKDDPNRYFASVCKRMYKDSSDNDRSHGHEFPIWIKIGRDIPFIEMRIAEALRKAGIVYDDQQGVEPDSAFYEAARSVIAAAEIEGLRVIARRTHYKMIDIHDFKTP